MPEGLSEMSHISISDKTRYVFLAFIILYKLLNVQYVHYWYICAIYTRTLCMHTYVCIYFFFEKSNMCVFLLGNTRKWHNLPNWLMATFCYTEFSQVSKKHFFKKNI